MSSFRDFLHSLGIIPPLAIEPGRWMRCGTEDKPRSKNGAFKLAADEMVGWGQNYAVQTEMATWWRDKKENLPVFDPAVSQARYAAEMEARRVAVASAQKHWDSCRGLAAGHPYLTKKRLDMHGLCGLRVDSEGRLVVPMFRGGRVQSLQTINAEGEKRFFIGAPVKGAAFTIARKMSTVSVLTEGLATGATIAAALPSASVVVAFSASNLLVIAEEREWAGFCVVAADNDYETAAKIGRNPGVDAGRKAAAIIGCDFCAPEDIRGTDWNDAFAEDLEQREARELVGAGYPQSPSQLRKAALSFIALQVQRKISFVVPKK